MIQLNAGGVPSIYRIAVSALDNTVSAMDTVIRDALFCPHSIVTIDLGADRLVFERCKFSGGEIHVAPEVEGKIFVSCLFQGTMFTGQPLSPRIAADSHWQPAAIEEAYARHHLGSQPLS